MQSHDLEAPAPLCHRAAAAGERRVHQQWGGNGIWQVTSWLQEFRASEPVLNAPLHRGALADGLRDHSGED